MFAGYRLPSQERAGFFKELGETFMPGTPAMLAPLGLGAYVAAVLDLEPEAGLPDEVALIVYASRDAYRAARESSVQGRMYTHSHAGVFDMARSRGQFPGPPTAPDKLPAGDRWSWHLFGAPVDWQSGVTRLLFVRGRPALGSMQEAVLETTAARGASLAALGVDQMIVLAAPEYAALWLHASGPIDAAPAALGVLPAGVEVARDLVATPVPMRTMDEAVRIEGPAAFAFRFVRDLRFFL